ncbi:tRNA (adenosine(37)-N6)-threonylcarbamoyltransferase complex dimerization subunit type 1 TsaB [uncultured Paludibaculum sp.]|uniref:tRNA (adenosine(37)-N6)-threonylcarbamoyltransferase complex dimerization subunit type 1 TsaB n=1 Tax=uncultured Paludibaculum sp. TaxID=1765020 RepID=UPI002AAAD0DE|nr:tRNA (adenosine(37)-N6)-threonylcarbamoyltransferase complex dimerization subunit type 1 TsaB [uncultured Paludibaculum sp.]
MPRIVAIDTASEFGSIALVEDGEVLEELILHSPDGFGHVLFPHLDRLMRRHGWKHENVAGYAAGSGPGSFTGVRVAIAAVKGLSEATGAQAAAISNLQAMSLYGTSALRAPFFDARRGEIYAALYASDQTPAGPEIVTKFQSWHEALPQSAELLTPDPAIFAVEATQTPRALAGAIGRLAASRLTDPMSLDANYVRRSDAELNWVDK